VPFASVVLTSAMRGVLSLRQELGRLRRSRGKRRSPARPSSSISTVGTAEAAQGI
jgi:hypothetical protein